MMHERGSPMNKNSRSGSLTSEFSIKAVGLTIPDDQLIAALVKRILSKVVTQDHSKASKLTYFSCLLGLRR